jgi:hypothetical protein
MGTAEPDLIFRKDLCFYQIAAAAAASCTAFAVMFDPKNLANLKRKDCITLKGIATGDRHFFPYEIHTEAVAENISQSDFLGTICMMLANTAYESVKHRNDYSPEFEFFRHIRHAASHLNHFRFAPNEPRNPTSWRGIMIDHTKKGASNPLHGTGCFGRFLGVADIFVLLWDIEQKLIAQDASSKL